MFHNKLVSLCFTNKLVSLYFRFSHHTNQPSRGTQPRQDYRVRLLIVGGIRVSQTNSVSHCISDSAITPINPPEGHSHEKIIESDSLSDFYLQEVNPKQHKHRRKKKHDHRVDPEAEDDGI